MKKENQEGFNQAILLPLALPFVLIGINLLWPFFGLGNMDGTFPDPDVVNHHFFGLWILAFAVPYFLVLLFRDDKDIFITTKLAVVPPMAVSLLDPFFQYYDRLYFILAFWLTVSGAFGLFWKIPEIKKKDLGKYPLSADRKNRVMFSTSCLHENVQIIGGTGTGKTHYVMKPFIAQTILQGLGCFIYDVKANMARDTAFWADKADCRRILHFNLADPSESHNYNPLYGDDSDAIANRVYAALYFDTQDKENYYAKLAEAFLHNLVGLLKTEIKTITFQDLLICTQEADSFKNIGWFCDKHPETPYAQYFRDQWLSKPAKERRMELTGLVNNLQRFCNSEWSYLLNVREPDIRMSDVVRKGQIFLFTPYAARYPSDAKRLSILAMMDLAEQVADRYRVKPDKPFRVFLDEFYNLAYPQFIDFINKCREAQVNLFLAHQSLGDLRGVSPEFLEQVMNTASNKIILRVNDPDTAEAFARQFGTERDRDYKVESFGASGTLMGYAKPLVEKFRFHPNRIKELKVGHAIIKIVDESGVRIVETHLRLIRPIPDEFRTDTGIYPRFWKGRKNESTVEELCNPKKEGATKETAKIGSRMGENHN